MSAILLRTSSEPERPQGSSAVWVERRRDTPRLLRDLSSRQSLQAQQRLSDYLHPSHLQVFPVSPQSYPRARGLRLPCRVLVPVVCRSGSRRICGSDRPESVSRASPLPASLQCWRTAFSPKGTHHPEENFP